MAKNITIYLHGEFGTDILSDFVIPQIDAAIAEKVEIINFDISSIGGSVKTGREIMGAMERAKLAGVQIATQCLSFAYSMGANVFLMGTKGMRKMSEHAELMLHPVMGVAEGNAKDMMQVVTSLQEMSNNLLEYATKGNEANAEAIKASFENEEMIGAAKAISLGLADGYVEKLKAVAYYSNKNTEMKKENIEEAKGILAQIKALFTKVKNASVVAGETTLYYDGELNTGTPVFTDEAMTVPAPDGTYGDYTVSEGKVTSIAAEPNAELEAANAKIAELEAAIAAVNAEKEAVIAAKEAEIVAKETEIAENKVKFEAVNAKVEQLSNIVLGEDGKHKEIEDENKGLTKAQIEKKNFFASFEKINSIKN